MTTAKFKVCKACKVEFIPRKPLQRACGLVCAIELSRAARVAAQKKAFQIETKRRIEGLKNRGQWQKEAQVAFNAFIRARDAHLPCISCGATTGQMHAGHYKATGSHPELRFNEFNCHAQCATCNNHLSGNLINYRIGLLAKIGIELVTWLEGPHDALKPTIEDLRFLKKHYREQVKLLEVQRNET
jgi:5-methylcytosine-specific restriction endonuclease McrA